ncbi:MULTISPECIES: polymorphic toxin type 8 domain-containing protein, partial [Clostridium]
MAKIGRKGKQARLKELVKDLKLSRSLRGELKRDINLIKKGRRRTIRVPKGYELAHRRGFEARKGYGYAYSDLQVIRNHRIQHRIDKYGKLRR